MQSPETSLHTLAVTLSRIMAERVELERGPYGKFGLNPIKDCTERGYVIERVPHGSSAHEKLHPGDEIVAVETRIKDNIRQLIDAAGDQVAVFVLRAGGGRSSQEVQVVGTRSREQRDAEGRQHAIDLDTPFAKRSRAEVDARVATARSLRSSTVDRRAQELALTAFKQYMTDEIDAEELGRCKRAARDQAESEDIILSALDTAFAKFTAATKALDAAEADVEAAGAELEAALRPLEEADSSKTKAASKPLSPKPEKKRRTVLKSDDSDEDGAWPILKRRG